MENYELFRSLRDTLYGKVRYGRHKQTREIVIVKEFYLECVKNRVSTDGHPVAEDAEAEIRIHAELEKGKNPHIVGLRGVHIEGDKMYVILEYCENSDFFSHIQKSTFSEERAKKYFIQLIKGVAYMHSKGYAHRDLSLENTLMDGKETLKICDFGLAMKVNDPEKKMSVDPNRRPGKIKFMPPEIYSVQDYNPFAADLYCCGIMLFVMLVGTFPYNIPTEEDERFKLIVNGNLNYLLKVWKLDHTISPAVKDLLSKLITYEKDRINLRDILNHPWFKQSSSSGGGGGGSKGSKSMDEDQKMSTSASKSTAQGTEQQEPGWFTAAPPKIKNQVRQMIVQVLLQYQKQPNKEYIVMLAKSLKEKYSLDEDRSRQLIVYFHAALNRDIEQKNNKMLNK
mmetsp:Transcript_5827/g.9034  ORF Transcript_5827/g.9034 Transcript_5827/m.9034 type:complete len:396 (-) Transcript_5827:381-1568(-)